MDQGHSIGGALMIHNNCSVTVLACHFDQNKAKLAGVAWFDADVKVNIDGSTFVNNTAMHFVGVFWVSKNTTVIIRNSDVMQNKAHIMAEFAMILYQSGMRVSNSKFQNNSHGAVDGLLVTGSSYLTLDNCDIYDHQTFGVKSSIFDCTGDSMMTIKFKPFCT